MKARRDIKVTTYDVDKGFKVEVVEDKELFEAWLYEPSYGVKMLMFGVPKWQCDRKRFVSMVKANYPSYIETYAEQYMDYNDMAAVLG